MAGDVSYSFTGTCGGGEETPRFNVELRSLDVPIARIESDGQGGCARVYWLVESPVVREAARVWLVSEAERLYPEFCGNDLLAHPRESSILVVPEYVGRKGGSSSMRRAG